MCKAKQTRQMILSGCPRLPFHPNYRVQLSPMSVQIARLIGGAGTGKTTELLNLMDRALETYHDPFEIGFVSFTRAARREASTRAGDRYGQKPADLEQAGWFKTLHAICYKCLGVGKELLSSNKESREWIQEAVGEPVGVQVTSLEGEWFQPSADRTAAMIALTAWECARSRLLPLKTVHEEIDRCVGSGEIPSLEYCKRIVEEYELSKRLDGRLDFTDLLARFAGWEFDSDDGAERCTPQGVVPDIPVWLLDEQQDASPLLHSVCERLVASAKWVYVAGDFFQSIYGFAGADPTLFKSGWGDCKERTMPQSWRCPPVIHDLGERILSRCTDYWDRKIKPADHQGSIEEQHWRYLSTLVKPSEEWLVLARTNFLANRLAQQLDAASIPWLPTKGRGRWSAPVRLRAVQALRNIQAGAPIDGAEWLAILDQVKMKAAGETLFIRGTKRDWTDLTDAQAQERAAWVQPEHLSELGAAPAFLKQIQSGAWMSWFDHIRMVCEAIDKWGDEIVAEPKIRLGTVHSAKGAQSDNVALLTTIPKQIENAKQTEQGANEERRVSYVGVTRTRRRLVILNEPSSRRQVHKMELEI